jgi:hypothetical protein
MNSTPTRIAMINWGVPSRRSAARSRASNRFYRLHKP